MHYENHGIISTKYLSSVLPCSPFCFASIINLSCVGHFTTVKVAKCVIYNLRIVLTQELLTISITTTVQTSRNSLHKLVYCVQLLQCSYTKLFATLEGKSDCCKLKPKTYIFRMCLNVFKHLIVFVLFFDIFIDFILSLFHFSILFISTGLGSCMGVSAWSVLLNL